MRLAKLASVIAAVTIATAACSGSVATPGATGPAATGPEATGQLPNVTVPPMPAAGGGSCQVSVTGGATASWKTDQDLGTLMLSYWLSASERSMLSLEGESMIFNCKGAGGSLSFLTPTGTTAADFVEGPKEYVIPVAGILGGAKPGQISVLFSTSDKKQLWKVVEAGSFKVTTFGGGKFAGTFSFKVGRLADDLTTILDTAVVSGSFDLGCTSHGCS